MQQLITSCHPNGP